MSPPTKSPPPATVWWSNAIFFVFIHVASVIGIYHRPPNLLPRATLFMSFLLWQAAEFGITIGYHRLYAHRAFRAGFSVRLLLAILGSSAFQGSIKVFETSSPSPSLVQRFTDDPLHDPYAATRGLLYSHMGWIFFKPKYDRLNSVDRDDLENDSVVRFQHKYYVPLALFFGLVLPTLLGILWDDPLGSFIWGGLVTTVAVWHCTFLVNSLAHWDGLQPYTDENTSRGNLLLALLTGGEGNHNFHAFPHDYRSGPSTLEWDPSKWIILVLHYLGLVKGLRRAREEDIVDAKEYMQHKHHDHVAGKKDDPSWNGPEWKLTDLKEFMLQERGRCLVVVDGFVIDVSAYMGEHPGGSTILRAYSINLNELALGDQQKQKWRDASWAFGGGLNNHSRGAVKRMREIRIARLLE
ncbi:hypothetical protein SERLADRAFT_432659 [Serpula lacrymans var. lacrymans S7.9]|uniref:Acyl-CoA desaturase n=1 Tax=Serpula lacrymans var. lacrymans (strain S7.9) TaxID=578457 RepID=F8NG28_SERL9|nr:uncharacterized protein SERLADRAFT_432659 [Serpula lacrymans var. lacrymans S7.9]EGO30998.1 hypothetical protein SERLADRAFT_432659 [Serpula lacrymans var. lacrymans S7.9]